MEKNSFGKDYELLWHVLSVVNKKKMFLESRAREKAYMSMAKLCKKYDPDLEQALDNLEPKNLGHKPPGTKGFESYLNIQRSIVRLSLEKLPTEDIVVELLLMNKDFKDGAMFSLWLILTSIKEVLPKGKVFNMSDTSFRSFWEKNEKKLEDIRKNRSNQ